MSAEVQVISIPRRPVIMLDGDRRSRTEISLNPSNDTTIDLDNCQRDELDTYDTWQRAEVKREKRSASALTAWTWLAQQSGSRPAPPVYVT